MGAILLLNGPNLNLLGTREPGIYGSTTLASIEAEFEALCKARSINCYALQSNAEHDLIEAIHQAPGKPIDVIVFNPAAFTHTSVALRDALLAVAIPFVEVHLSEVNDREPFRRTNYFSDIAAKVITGQGAGGYVAAFEHAVDLLENADGH